MATDSERKKLLYKIAKAYYEDALTQHEIGKRFGLSRIKVSRLLQQARDERIVQIFIPPQDPNADLERALEARFGLDEAVIVTPSSYDHSAILRALGPAAADYLMRCLDGSEVLGLSWGTTLLAGIEAVPAHYWTNMRVVQILGGLGQPDADTYGGDLAHRLAQALGARPRLLAAPGVVANKLVRDALLADPQIADTLSLGVNADILLVGIGIPSTPDSVVKQAGILSPDEFDQLKALGAVGDIALRFFDRNGQAIKHALNDRIIGLDLEQIRNIPRVIGVAGCPEKLEVIRAALRGKLISVLVTDDRTASRLLEEEVLPAALPQSAVKSPVGAA